MSGLIDTTSEQRTLSKTHTENLTSAYYRVESFGFLRLTSNEKFGQTWYPSPSDIIPPGWFGLDVHAGSFGDFNGDGYVDVILQPMLHPHVVPHTTQIAPIVLIQNQTGGFLSPENIIVQSNFPEKHFLYRIGVADFNKDGRSDIALSSMGSVNRTSDSTYSTYFSPLVVFGSSSSNFKWIDSYANFSVRNDSVTPFSFGYSYGHSMAVGDFNGDSYPDWFSNWFVFYNNKNDGFSSELITPNALAALEKSPWSSKWVWPLVNATVSADFNKDGFDDLLYSSMPNHQPDLNGGDLVMVMGSKAGLISGEKVVSIARTNDIPGNVGTNFMVATDINGDGNIDVIFMEHYWSTDSGDSTNYYAKGKLRAFLGDGKGGLKEDTGIIKDPYSGHRHGEGNLHVIDVNGDGWKDLVLTGYQVNPSGLWASEGKEFDYSTVFLNDRGVLRYVDPSHLAYVQPYQFAGDESLKDTYQEGVSKLIPVDIGNDGMVDFLGFVQTKLREWPQVEQQYTYVYVSKAIAPLGRSQANESLTGTVNADKIYGFDGNDLIQGGAGDDTIDGGEGLDSAIYSASVSNYTIAKISNGLSVTDKTKAEGTDTLLSVERLIFFDSGIAFDIEGNAGKAYRVYKAAFNRDPMKGDTEGLGYWIAQIDKGMDLIEVSARFIDSQEFKTLYGSNSSNAEFLTKLYQNVLGRSPEADGYNWWLNQLDNNPEKTRAKVLADFAESSENQTGTLTIIGGGITYDPWDG